jgi:hypothetical protein
MRNAALDLHSPASGGAVGGFQENLGTKKLGELKYAEEEGCGKRVCLFA